MRPPRLPSISVDRLALLSILLLALGLRVYNIDWDRGKFLHPDELHILNVGSSQVDFGGPWDWETLKDPDVSLLNPRSLRDDNGMPMNYAYGALPLLVTDAVGELLERVTGDPYSEAYGDFQIIGRAGSAIVDTLTVLLVFLIGSRMFGRRTGLMAAAIYAGTPMAIQLSHFFTTDAWLTFFVTLTIYATLLALDRGTHAWFAVAGACFGWSIASKGSVILLAGIIVLAAGFVAWRQRSEREGSGEIAVGFVGRCVVAGIAALVAFTMFEPYVWLRMDVYLDQLREQQGIVLRRDRRPLHAPVRRDATRRLPDRAARPLGSWPGGRSGRHRWGRPPRSTRLAGPPAGHRHLARLARASGHHPPAAPRSSSSATSSPSRPVLAVAARWRS
jgi:hypothetical protein